MSTTDETKPASKSKRRKGKAERGKKAVSQAGSPETPAAAERRSAEQQRQPKPVLAESPKVVSRPLVEEPVVAAAPPEPQPAVAPPPPKPVKAAPPAAEPKSAAPKSAESKSVESKSAESKPAEPKPVEFKSAEPPSAAPLSAEPPPAEPAPVELAPVSLQTIANAYRDYTRRSIEEFGSFVEQLSGARSLDKAMTVQTEFVKRAYETSVAESQKICELHNRLAKQTLDPFKTLAAKTPAPQGKP